jgi:hypothetical protein
MGNKKLIKIIKSSDNNNDTLKKLLNDLDIAEKQQQQLHSEEQEEKKETDKQREARFTELRKARQEDRTKHPENYPPLQYWWSPGSDHTMRCYYFPRDWRQTQEELDFYHKIASDYEKGIIYRFHSYDMFLAYNHYILDEVERWRDFLELGHVHSPDENLEQWKAHDTDEHHLHKEGWYPPTPPVYFETLGDLIKIQTDHMRDIGNKISSSSRRRREEEE